MYRSSYKNVQIISTPGFRGLLIFANEKKIEFSRSDKNRRILIPRRCSVYFTFIRWRFSSIR